VDLRRPAPEATGRKKSSIALGSRMEITVPVLGDRSRSWVSCTVVDREDDALERYIVKVDGFPAQVAKLRNVPGMALRLPPVQTGFNLAESATDQESRTKASAALAAGLGRILGAPMPFDCRRFPQFCKEPFNCHNWSPMEGMDWYYHGMARNGKGNPRSWCSLPSSASFLSTCLFKKDLVKAAEIRKNETQKSSQVERELDASRCFIEGFCSDTAVSRSTTLDQANQLCNMRYGQERWSLYGTYLAATEDSHGAGGKHDGTNGYKGKYQTTPITIGTCATGRYHCDVMYCKQTYCKQDYYKHKYGHFLRDAF